MNSVLDSNTEKYIYSIKVNKIHMNNVFGFLQDGDLLGNVELHAQYLSII